MQGISAHREREPQRLQGLPGFQFMQSSAEVSQVKGRVGVSHQAMNSWILKVLAAQAADLSRKWDVGASGKSSYSFLDFFHCFFQILPSGYSNWCTSAIVQRPSSRGKYSSSKLCVLVITANRQMKSET